MNEARPFLYAFEFSVYISLSIIGNAEAEMKLARLLAIIVVLVAGTITAAGSFLELVVNACDGDVCVIRQNRGGTPIFFEIAAHAALKQGVHIRVDGLCASSCVIFASIARKNVCITKKAQMRIHRGTITRVFDPSGQEVVPDTPEHIRTYFNPPPNYRKEFTFYTPDYGDDINAWALAEGKMPYSDTKLYELTRSEALKFWKPCK